MNNTFLTSLVILIPILEGLAIYFLIEFYNKHKVISTTETTKIKFIKKGVYEVKGKIISLSEKIFSPFSEKPCVYFEFKVDKETGSEEDKNWFTIIDDFRCIKFGVDDGSGIAIIDLMDAKLDLKVDRTEDSGVFNRATPKMNKALKKYNQTSQGWIFQKTIRYREVYLEEGDELYVHGEVKEFDGNIPIFRSGDIPLLISDKSEEELLKQTKMYIIITIVVSIVLPLIEIVLLWKFY